MVASEKETQAMYDIAEKKNHPLKADERARSTSAAKARYCTCSNCGAFYAGWKQKAMYEDDLSQKVTRAKNR